jgi:hypothetical protein
MNAGLTNLTTLKSWLLPQSMQAQTTWDEHIAMIGRGVLGAMEAHCGRKFGRVENWQQRFHGGVDRVWLDRAPVETLPVVELRVAGSEEWLEVDGVIEQCNEDTGLVLFTGTVGTDRDALRLTYTGGYWVDESEDGSGTPPAGAVAAPEDLVWAWALQCEHVWSRRDKLGAGLVQQAGKGAALENVELLPVVREVLARYRRLAMM